MHLTSFAGEGGIVLGRGQVESLVFARALKNSKAAPAYFSIFLKNMFALVQVRVFTQETHICLHSEYVK